MFHPLIRLLVTKPELLAHHASAYLALAAVEADVAVRALRLRACLTAAALAFLVGGIVLGGVALLLIGVVRVDDMPMPWLLAAVPGLLLALGAVLGTWATRASPSLTLAPLQAQWQADLRLLAEAQAP